MRARWLKPEFFTDKKIAAMGPIVALVYQALWCMADDSGTVPCDADTVKAQMFYRWSAVGVPEISEALHALAGAGRIVRYQVGDDVFATIPKWTEHQQVHKPSKFRHPAMSQGVALPVPGECGTSAAPLPASPPPRHLDTKTPTPPPQKPAVVRTARPAPTGPAFDLAPYLDAHAARFPGSIPPAGHLGKVLKALEAKHGAAETLARWTVFLAAKGQFGVDKFAETWSEWGPRSPGSGPPNGAAPSRVLAGTEMILE
jgi:hypothetical protein